VKQKSFLHTVLAVLILPAFILSACSSPASLGTLEPTEISSPTVNSTPTSLPPAPTALPATPTIIQPTATSAPTLTPAPVGEGELIVMASFIQVERGFLPWVDEFTAQTGCKVSLEDFVDYDNSLIMIEEGEIDIVMAGASSGRLIASGLMQEIHTSQVPSWRNVNPFIVNATWNSTQGKVYGVPYLWIPNVLMYNTDVFPSPPTSWEVTFTEQKLPDGKSNEKRVLAPYQVNYIADAAMYLKYTNPLVGISNPFELTEAQLIASMDLLRKQQQILGAYWNIDGPVEDFISKGYAVSGATPRLVRLMIEAGMPVSSTVPQEGATALAFTGMLAKNASHPICAYQWLEYSINAKVQGDTAAHFDANPFVPAACEGASELLSAEDCQRNGVDRSREFHFWQTPISVCGNGEEICMPADRWVSEFTALVSP
jgi:putative spermidine/putrescine transport system substrate-binding protein